MLNIIIVEDHRPLRETLVDVMAAEGHQVAAFDSAEEFCVRSDLGSVDILVLDLNLPGEDGISLARRVRAKHPGIGIVMLSARAEPEQREIGYETGADIYLTKPSSAPELTSSIRALARRISRNPVPNGLVLDPKAMTLTGAAETVYERNQYNLFRLQKVRGANYCVLDIPYMYAYSYMCVCICTCVYTCVICTTTTI